MIDRISKDEYLKLLKKQSAGNKYNNEKTDLGRGEFDSKFEAKYERECFFRLKAKEIKDYAIQVRFPLDVNGLHIADYIMDFVITHLDESIELVETKGYPTKEWRIKWKLLHALYGNIYKITLIKKVKGGGRNE